MNKPSILNQSGIYKIINKTNNKIYIGSSKNIRKRWKGHRTLLNKEKHYNEHLLAAYKKYGKENFIWEVVEFIDVDKLQEREQYWINFFESSDREKGYNLCPAAYSNLGLKHTDESRRNMSLAHLGHKHTPESRKKISESQYKTVYQFDLKGNFIQKFNSILEAEKKTGIERQLISGCCRKITKSAKGYFWSFEKSFTLYKRNHFREAPWKYKTIQCSKSLKIWKSIKDASKELNLTIHQVHYKIKKGQLIYV
jgi:hypothetical protein